MGFAMWSTVLAMMVTTYGCFALSTDRAIVRANVLGLGARREPHVRRDVRRVRFGRSVGRRATFDVCVSVGRSVVASVDVGRRRRCSTCARLGRSVAFVDAGRRRRGSSSETGPACACLSRPSVASRRLVRRSSRRRWSSSSFDVGVYLSSRRRWSSSSFDVRRSSRRRCFRIVVRRRARRGRLGAHNPGGTVGSARRVVAADRKCAPRRRNHARRQIVAGLKMDDARRAVSCCGGGNGRPATKTTRATAVMAITARAATRVMTISRRRRRVVTSGTSASGRPSS